MTVNERIRLEGQINRAYADLKALIYQARAPRASIERLESSWRMACRTLNESYKDLPRPL